MSRSAKTDIWMPLYVGDYLKDTMHLSARDHGCYLLLIMAYWTRQGPLPDDDEVLAGIAKVTQTEWQTVRKRLASFFQTEPFALATGSQCDSKVWRHKRIDAELEKSLRKKEARKIAGIAGNEAKKRKIAAIGSQMGTQLRPQTDTQTGTFADATGPQKDRSSPSPSPSLAGESVAERPSLEEVIAYCQTIGLAEWRARDWFDEMQGCGWLDFSHRPVSDWRAMLRRVKTKWEADGRPSGPPSRAAATAGGVGDKIGLQNELKRNEAKLLEIEGQASHDAFGARYTEQQRSERKKLRERNQEILRLLGYQA